GEKTMFDRFDRSLRLLRESWAVLMEDKTLLVFPLCSGICSALATAAFLVPLWFSSGMAQMANEHGATSFHSAVRFQLNPRHAVVLFLFYLVTYTIVVFFNSGLVACAGKRLRGGDPTAAEGFQFAFSNMGRILAWAALAATVGTILRLIEERAEWLGRLVVS